LAEDKPEKTLQLAESLITTPPNSSPSAIIPRLEKLRGDALLGLVREDEAENALHKARAASERLGWRSLLWRIDATLAALYARQARHDESDQAASAAQATIEQLAASLDQADRRDDFRKHALGLLERELPRQVHRPAKKSRTALSPRELEVAERIALGKSSREIATELVLSQRTVETHVSNILSKLGFSARSQIAAWVVDQGLV